MTGRDLGFAMTGRVGVRDDGEGFGVRHDGEGFGVRDDGEDLGFARRRRRCAGLVSPNNARNETSYALDDTTLVPVVA
jgi:hypothetical protein